MHLDESSSPKGCEKPEMLLSKGICEHICAAVWGWPSCTAGPLEWGGWQRGGEPAGGQSSRSPKVGLNLGRTSGKSNFCLAKKQGFNRGCYRDYGGPLPTCAFPVSLPAGVVSACSAPAHQGGFCQMVLVPAAQSQGVTHR